MALWNQIRRCGMQRLVLSSQNPSYLFAPVRSLAVPAHVKAKQQQEEEEEPTGTRVNDDITAAYVRLVTDEGHGVVSRREALDRAKMLNLDLVEVQRTAKPPVCKLMDFHKEKFKQESKEKERTKSKSTATLRNGENKEVRFTAKTEPKDLQTKAETITRLMERGYRVKCTVLRSGREEEDLRGLLPRLVTLINDVAIVESGPHVVGTKQAYMIMRHVKFSTKKSAKKAIKALDALNQHAVLNVMGTVNSSVQGDMPHQAEECELTECGSETESKDLSDQDMNIQKPLHQKPLPSKSVPDSSRSEMDVNKEQTTLKSANAFVPLRSEPSVVEVNRYVKQSEPKGFQQNRERMPHQAARNEGDTHVQFDPKQRRFDNSSNPSSPSSVYGRGPAVVKPSNPSSSTPSFGNFSTSKPVPSRDQINLGANGDKPRIPSPTFTSASKTVPSNEQRNSKEGTVDQTRNPGSPARSYGIFSSSKPVGSGDQSSTNNTVHKPSNTSIPSSPNTVHKPSNTSIPSSPTQSYGIFSSSKPVGSGDQKSSKDATENKPRSTSNPSSPTQSYGLFSTTKPVGSGDQKSSKDATENKPSSTSSAHATYGIFSKSKAGSGGVK